MSRQLGQLKLLPGIAWKGYPFASETKERIKNLLTKGFEQCAQDTNERHVEIETSYANCFGTILYILGLTPYSDVVNYGQWNDGYFEACDNLMDVDDDDQDDQHDSFIKIINIAGYELADNYKVIEGNDYLPTVYAKDANGDNIQWESIGEGHIVTDVFKNLKIGDVLTFTPISDPATISHTAIVVGFGSDGTPLIFEKPSLLCGPISPYEVIPITDYLSKRLNTNGELNPNFMQIYRKN